jgi:predicted aconitase with swiveling domain
MTGSALEGRAIYRGRAAGVALVSSAPLSFYGGFDLDTGIVTEAGHPLEGQPVGGRLLVFPTGKGSTVGSYAILRLKKNGVAPAALLMAECDTIVAVGAIIAEIPCVDLIAIREIETGDQVTVDNEQVQVTRRG